MKERVGNMAIKIALVAAIATLKDKSIAYLTGPGKALGKVKNAEDAARVGRKVYSREEIDNARKYSAIVVTEDGSLSEFTRTKPDGTQQTLGEFLAFLATRNPSLETLLSDIRGEDGKGGILSYILSNQGEIHLRHAGLSVPQVETEATTEAGLFNYNKKPATQAAKVAAIESEAV